MLSKPLHSVVIFILIHVVLFSIFRDLYLSRSPYHTAYSLLDLCLFQHSEMENVCSGYMNIKMLSWLLTDFDGGAEYTVSIPRSKIARISQVFSYFFFRSRTYYYLCFVGKFMDQVLVSGRNNIFMLSAKKAGSFFNYTYIQYTLRVNNTRGKLTLV
jgi:hypothetical protein